MKFFLVISFFEWKSWSVLIVIFVIMIVCWSIYVCLSHISGLDFKEKVTTR